VSDVSVRGTDWGVVVEEDFCLISVPFGHNDEP
jgi:hypothetical protein